MKHSLRLVSAGALLASVLPLAAHAESNFVTGAGSLNATARVDFQITIPRFVLLRVGSAAATIDQIVFAPTVAQIDALTPVAGTGGDLAGGKVTVRVLGNGGAMTLSAAQTLALSNGTDTIPWTQIAVAAAGTAPAHPTVGVGSVALANSAGITNLSGDWTYTYTNGAVYPAGTYNGAITYTATLP